MTTETEPIVREIDIAATPETVFGFFTEASLLCRWLAVEATTDARPGGVCNQTHVDDEGRRYDMRGEFVEVVPSERVVFTWGFADADVGLPPGSTVVEVTLTEIDGGTRVRLEHRGLPASEIASHVEGWTAMLGRLVEAVSAA